MLSIKEQFSFEKLPQHFEKDSHIDLQGLAIEELRVLAGESPQEDILAVLYAGSPNMSFYDWQGKLIDVDHYLPDTYLKEDAHGADAVIMNLRDFDEAGARNPTAFVNLLDVTLEMGSGNLSEGLRNLYGLETSEGIIQQFRQANGFSGGDFRAQLRTKYTSFFDFLEALILFMQRGKNGYVHITPNDNIIITPLLKRSGPAVILETQNTEGHLLPPNQWLITRTHDIDSLDQALIFRTKDVQEFFEAEGNTVMVETDRYRLYHTPGKIAIDSLLDNTNNLLKLNALHDCFQILPSDRNIIVVLSHQQEVTVVNTHRSIVPHKWPKKIILKEPAYWVRADENLHTLFVQQLNGRIQAFDITGDHPEELAELGAYNLGFAIDQSGSLCLKTSAGQKMVKIRTNVNQLEIPSEQQNFKSILENLSYLFKGESLFTETRFARQVSPEVKKEEKIPSIFEAARFDFETNVEHLLAEAGTSYEALLTVQNKVAIARQNLGEELTSYAEKEDIFLVGQRLQSAINSILKPSEKRVRNLVEESRAEIILEEVKAFREKMDDLSNPNAYREILNALRQYQDELNSMLPENTRRIISEFKNIQGELNAVFSDQIARDGTALQAFITGEIEQIEAAIDDTHDPRQLEVLLSTHPASLELMTLLKQPFILQNIAKERSLSPAGIQARLYTAIANRKVELQKELERQEAERSAAKLQLAKMIQESIDFFVKNHTGGFSDLSLSGNAAYQQLLGDIQRLEKVFSDVRLAMDMRRKLEVRIMERNRADLEKMVTFEGKYAFIKNDPDLYVDLESTVRSFPQWDLRLIEKKGFPGTYLVTFERDSDRSVFRPNATENLASGKSFEISETEYADFSAHFDTYINPDISYELADILWLVSQGKAEAAAFPQFSKDRIAALLPGEAVQKKALRCALEKKDRENQERTRLRRVPKIGPEFIDDTPFFQTKLQEFVIKVKLQLVSGAGAILLSGPPSTGKSAFLKFIASVMNREYFEHAADKWQTKNSLVTSIKFGENGPYATPAGFTRAITTPHSLINIEEIKEWPEALRKSLNPFFAGSKSFVAPDGTHYNIGENILLCAAANLGSMYRQDDEPFTADFWSRIEVVEYGYAPEQVDREYYHSLHQDKQAKFMSMQQLVRHYFQLDAAPTEPWARAQHLARVFLEFILLPKADEKVKRENLRNHIHEYFERAEQGEADSFNPEEAAKVALRRIKDLQNFSAREFFDLYDHFINKQNIRTSRLRRMQSGDVDRYEHLKVLVITLRYLEGALRHLRRKFYATAGQTEIEGTNREFIKCVYLLGMV